LMSLSLVNPGGHSSNGLSGTKNSALLKPAASAGCRPGRAGETTVIDLRVAQPVSADPVHDRLAASSDIVGGMVARNPQIAFFERGKEFGAEVAASGRQTRQDKPLRPRP